MSRISPYETEHLRLLENAIRAAGEPNGRRAVFVTGLENLPGDKRAEAVHPLNLQRNRFGEADIAAIFWINGATLAEIANRAPDFYSCRTAAHFIEPPPDWDRLESFRQGYLQAIVEQNQFVNLQGLAPVKGGHIVQMPTEDVFIPLQVERQVETEEASLNHYEVEFEPSDQAIQRPGRTLRCRQVKDAKEDAPEEELNTLSPRFKSTIRSFQRQPWIN